MSRLIDFTIFSCKLRHLLLLGSTLPLSLCCLADTPVAIPPSAPNTPVVTTPATPPAPVSPVTTAASTAIDPITAASAPTSTPNTSYTTINPPAMLPVHAEGQSSTSYPEDDATADTGPVGTTDLWDRIRKGFALNDSDSPLVETHIEWYAQRPDYIRRMVERSRRYLFHILGEVEKRGMPTEIALLPMVESAYNPMAYSTSQASGIWQFIPSTAKLFGLKQTGWYDGRRDIIAATDAALDYLTKLHTQFGTWELALAAYNCGEGCVAHAIAKNQALGLPTDYSSLNLPVETRHYVPKLLAIKQIIADPASVGLSLDSIPNQAYFTAVTLKQPIDVSLAAKLANMPVKDFISLNPAYNKPVVRSDTPTQLLLPVDKADTFSSNLQHYNLPLVSWQMYTAKLGERIKTIAKKFNVSVAWLIEHNPIHLSRKGKLTSEHTLIVPLHHSAANTTEPRHMIAQPDKSAYADASATGEPEKVSYSADTPRKATPIRPNEKIKVQPGDTLYGIAKRYQINPQDLKKWNHIGNKPLQPGETVRLSASGSLHNPPKQQTRHKKLAKTASAKPKKTSGHKQHTMQKA